MSSELMVMTFRRQNKAETVLGAIRVMRKSPILCLEKVVVATRDHTGEITIRPGQQPAAAQEDRDTKILLSLAELILGAPDQDAIDDITDRGMDGRFVSEIPRSMEDESSALFVLAREDGLHDAGETRSVLALFRGRIHQTSLPPEVEAYLAGYESRFMESQAKQAIHQREEK
ncbi:MAG: hypothetical protein P8189_26495 [Anaerolineae bacterium]|jgi:uncharacterized membrane protein